MTPNTPNQHGFDHDALLTRLLDGRAGEQDWLRLRDLVAQQPEVWSELAETTRFGAMLSKEIERETTVAEGVTLPHSSRRLRATLGGIRFNRSSGLGWAMAAVLGLAFITLNIISPRGSSVPGGNVAGLFSVSNPDQALDAYMQMGQKSGRVVGEVPQRFVIQQRPRTPEEGGGFEVTFLRQLIEKAVVNDVYQTGRDEAGQPVYVPMTAPNGARPSAPY